MNHAKLIWVFAFSAIASQLLATQGFGQQPQFIGPYSDEAKVNVFFSGPWLSEEFQLTDAQNLLLKSIKIWWNEETVNAMRTTGDSSAASIRAAEARKQKAPQALASIKELLGDNYDDAIQLWNRRILGVNSAGFASGSVRLNDWRLQRFLVLSETQKKQLEDLSATFHDDVRDVLARFGDEKKSTYHRFWMDARKHLKNEQVAIFQQMFGELIEWEGLFFISLEELAVADQNVSMVRMAESPEQMAFRDRVRQRVGAEIPERFDVRLYTLLSNNAVRESLRLTQREEQLLDEVLTAVQRLSFLTPETAEQRTELLADHEAEYPDVITSVLGTSSLGRLQQIELQFRLASYRIGFYTGAPIVRSTLALSDQQLDEIARISESLGNEFETINDSIRNELSKAGKKYVSDFLVILNENQRALLRASIGDFER